MVLFYKDFYSRGGVPSEIQNFIQFSHDAKIDCTVIDKYSDLIIYIIKNRRRCDLIFVGYFFVSYLFLWFLLPMIGVKYTIWPIGQISKFSLNKDLFSVSPILSDLKNSAQVHRLKTSYIKPIFLMISKLTFLLYKPKFWVFSTFELSEIKHYIGEVKYRFVSWVCGNNLNRYTKETRKDNSLLNVYTNRKILLCWSRLDIYTKGIDRFNKLSKELSKLNNQFLSLTCGPYYSGDMCGLENRDSWIVINTNKENGFEIQFLDADFIVLLSRWDGFPRVLREALIHRIPIIVSEETHFGEIVEKYNVGLMLKGDYESLSNLIQRFDYSKANFSGAIDHINRCFLS
jgi:hypothetical protein